MSGQLVDIHPIEMSHTATMIVAACRVITVLGKFIYPIC